MRMIGYVLLVCFTNIKLNKITVKNNVRVCITITVLPYETPISFFIVRGILRQKYERVREFKMCVDECSLVAIEGCAPQNGSLIRIPMTNKD